MDTQRLETPAQVACRKVATGTLMRLNEVAALLDVAPATIHSLELPSIRIGKSLRFDPADVRKLIEKNKEAVIPTHASNTLEAVMNKTPYTSAVGSVQGGTTAIADASLANVGIVPTGR